MVTLAVFLELLPPPLETGKSNTFIGNKEELKNGY
jgi:hypothetical protein